MHSDVLVYLPTEFVCVERLWCMMICFCVREYFG
jgi:hypothetical protein